MPDVLARHQGPGLGEWAVGREGEDRTGHDLLGEHHRLARLPGEALLVSPMNRKGWGVDAGPDLVPGGSVFGRDQVASGAFVPLAAGPVSVEREDAVDRLHYRHGEPMSVFFIDRPA